MNNFQKNLAYIRTTRKLKQSEIADLVGVNQNVWSNYERGRSEPDHTILMRMSEVFAVDIDTLLKKSLYDVHLSEEFDREHGLAKSPPNGLPNSLPNDENEHILREPEGDYNGPKQAQKEGEIIDSLFSVIDSQKELINSLNAALSRFKDHLIDPIEPKV